MARMELTDGSERPVLKLALGVVFLLLAVGYAEIESPRLFVVGYAVVGVLYVLEYASPRFHRRMEEFRSSVSRLVAATVFAAVGAVLFWHYGHPQWARAFAFGTAVFALLLVFLRIRKR